MFLWPLGREQLQASSSLSITDTAPTWEAETPNWARSVSAVTCKWEEGQPAIPPSHVWRKGQAAKSRTLEDIARAVRCVVQCTQSLQQPVSLSLCLSVLCVVKVFFCWGSIVGADMGPSWHTLAHAHKDEKDRGPEGPGPCPAMRSSGAATKNPPFPTFFFAFLPSCLLPDSILAPRRRSRRRGPTKNSDTAAFATPDAGRTVVQSSARKLLPIAQTQFMSFSPAEILMARRTVHVHAVSGKSTAFMYVCCDRTCSHPIAENLQ